MAKAQSITKQQVDVRELSLKKKEKKKRHTTQVDLDICFSLSSYGLQLQSI